MFTIFALSFISSFTCACLGEMSIPNRPAFYWSGLGAKLYRCSEACQAAGIVLVLIICFLSSPRYLNIAVAIAGWFFALLSAGFFPPTVRATSPLWGTIAFVVILIATQPIAPLFASKSGRAARHNPSAPLPTAIQTQISRTPAKVGMTEKTLDKKFLSALSSAYISEQSSLLEKHIGHQGYKREEAALLPQVDARYENFANKKLAILRVSFTHPSLDGLKLVKIVGLADQQLVAVDCIREDGGIIEPLKNECGLAVAEAFAAHKEV